MISLHPLVQVIQEDIKQARRILHFLESDKFRKAYEEATELQRQTLAEFVRSKKERALREIVEVLIAKDKRLISLENLRAAASAQGIPYYASMTKEQLIKELNRNDVRAESGDDSECRQIGGLGRKPIGHTSPTLPGGEQGRTRSSETLLLEASR